MSMGLQRTLFAAVLAVTAASPARAQLPSGVSGSWYDTAHPGHGFSVEVLDAERAIAYWFAYDERGAPMHLYIDGTISDRTIHGPAYLGRGMPFGSFDRQRFTLGHWGEVAIQFQSCTMAEVRYDASGAAGGAAFGRGEILLTRLSRIGELPCDEAAFASVEAAAPLAPGLVGGTFANARFPPGDSGAPLRGAIDTQGQLWALSGFSPPGPQAHFPFDSPVLVPARATHGGAQPEAVSRVLPNLAFFREQTAPGEAQRGELRAVFATPLDATVTTSGGAERLITRARIGREFDSSALLGGLTAADLAGARFFTLLGGTLVGTPLSVEFGADGSLCISYTRCGTTPLMQGRYRRGSSTHAFFDFEVQDLAGHRIYRGRGWVHQRRGGVPVQITLAAGSSDGIGLGLQLERE